MPSAVLIQASPRFILVKEVDIIFTPSIFPFIGITKSKLPDPIARLNLLETSCGNTSLTFEAPELRDNSWTFVILRSKSKLPAPKTNDTSESFVFFGRSTFPFTLDVVRLNSFEFWTKPTFEKILWLKYPERVESFELEVKFTLPAPLLILIFKSSAH